VGLRETLYKVMLRDTCNEFDKKVIAKDECYYGISSNFNKQGRSSTCFFPAHLRAIFNLIPCRTPFFSHLHWSRTGYANLS